MSYFVFIAEVLMDIYLFFLDFKFWKKKRAQRRYEKENRLPKKRMIYPSEKNPFKIFGPFHYFNSSYFYHNILTKY